MRIKLAPGKQRELFLLAKNAKNLTWKKLAAIINYNEHYVKTELFNEKILMSEKTYKNLCSLCGANFDKYILQKLQNSWGQSKGGQKSKTPLKKPKLLVGEPSVELAEIFGIMLGDGNVWVRDGDYYVRVVGHLKEDKEYLLNFVRPLFQKVFGVQMQVQKYPKKTKLVLYKASKDLVFTFSEWGFPSGNKKGNNVSIPPWILESKKYVKACVRGLIDTDGSVCPITGRDYSYIWFKSAIPGLRASFSKAMNELGIKTSQWSKNKADAKQIFIGSRGEIIKYYTRIGFSNPKHSTRFSAPVV